MTEQEKIKCLETCLQYEMERQGSDLKVSIWKEDNNYLIAWHPENVNPSEHWVNSVRDLWVEYVIEDLFKHTYFVALSERKDNFLRQTLSALDIRKLN